MVTCMQVNAGQNRVGMIVDPKKDNLPFSFTVEVFEPGTVTTMATNPGFELFYVLQGKGTAFSDAGGVQDEVSEALQSLRAHSGRHKSPFSCCDASRAAAQ